MLHPHLPEDLKSFSKHLFATFLGLLMALGLEQWAEHRRENRLAHSFLENIQADLIWNLKAVKELEVTFAACQETDKAALTQLEAVLVARSKGQNPPIIERKGSYRADFRFSTSAWDAAKASGAFRHLPPSLLQELSEMFSQMKRIEDIQDRLLGSRQLEMFITFFGEDWNTLDTQGQQGVCEGLRFIRGTNDNWRRVCKGMIPELEKKTALVEEALRKF